MECFVGFVDAGAEGFGLALFVRAGAVGVREGLELDEFFAQLFEVRGEGRGRGRAGGEGVGEEVVVGLGEGGFLGGLRGV